MANQMIALGVRGPQMPDVSRVGQQFAQMANMMMQQRASERQAAQAAQAMQFAAAEEGRKRDLFGPQMAKAKSEAYTAQQKAVMDFMELSYEGVEQARGPEDVVRIADFLKQNFPDPVFAGMVDQTLADMPSDPALFPAWKEQTKRETLTNAQQLEQDFTQQNLGTSTRIVSAPKFGGGAATVVPGSEAAVTMKPTVVNVEGIGPVIVDPNTGQGYAAGAGAVGGYTAPPVGAGTPSVGGGGRGAVGARGNSADVVYGFGDYARPSKPISSMTIGEVQNFQKNELIPATRGEIGKGPRIGTGAVGTYQIVYGTLRDYAPKVLGPNWRNVQFTADVQDRIAKAIYEDVKDRNLKDTWAGLPANRPGAYSNVPWEQVRDQIAAVESGGGRGAAPTGGRGVAGGEAPRTMSQAASAAEKARKVKTFQDMTGVNLDTQLNVDTDPVSKLIKGSTSGAIEAVGAEIKGALPESMGGGATPGMKNIGQLETIATTLTLAFAPDGRLSTGVSNEDRRVIERQLGVIQDPMIPSGKRLAAWGEVKRIMARTIGMTAGQSAAPTGGGKKRKPISEFGR
jgi:hypothetical protein